MNTEEICSALSSEGKILCAVSGGADSMCLLHLLWSGGIPVCAAHYEHGLRGDESLRDAEFVSAWCAARGIPCAVEHGDVRAFAEAGGLGIEEAARSLRYDFLERVAAQFCCDVIVTAHNADDSAETMLLNLTRGSGARGLRGIPRRRGRILRPLLDCSRAEIEEYLEKNAVPHREDGSNACDEFARNRIRHRVMPTLRELNPAFAQAARRTARLMTRDEECLSELAGEFLARFYDGESLPAKDLSALHPAVSSRVLRELLGSGLDEGHVDAVLAFCAGSGFGFLDLPGVRIRREQGRLYFKTPESASLPERALCPGQTLEIPEAGLRVSADLVVYSPEIHREFKTYCFKYENIRGNTVLCTGRRPGDRMRPAGRGCTKSLKALFLEAGMTRAERDRTLVFRDGEGVLAVDGLAVDERSVAEPGEKVLRIKIESREDKT